MEKDTKTSKARMRATNKYRRKNQKSVYKQDLYRSAEKFLTEMVNDLDDVRMYQEAITERRRDLNDR